MRPTVGRVCCAEHVVKGFIVKRLCVLNLLPLREKISVIMTRFFQHGFGASATMVLFASLFLLSSMCVLSAPNEGCGELMSLVEQLRIENERLVRKNARPWWYWSWEKSSPPLCVEVIEPTECGCVSFGCCVNMGISRFRDMIWSVLSDPLFMTMSGVDVMKENLIERLPFIHMALGVILILLILNAFAFLAMRFAAVLGALRKILSFMFQMPLIVLIRKVLGQILGSVVPSSDSKKKEELKSKLERVMKEIDSIEVRSSNTIQSEKEKDLDSGVAHKQCERECAGQGTNQKSRKLRGIECEYCHMTNHRTANCYKRARDILRGRVAVEWRRKKVRFHDEPPQDAGETSGPTSKIVEATKAEEDCALMYTPAYIRGVRFPKCLIDTGSQVNLIPLKLLTKHGLFFDKAGIQKVQGFNGSEGSIIGSLTCPVQIGSGSTERELEFLVCPSVSNPILGLPALQKFGLMVDCENRELCEVLTRRVVRCIVVQKPKN